ncbi:hypothetical protein [Myroides odoratus]|uniref:hypothetical protein n=1 Tax=Myroides odoratus TaxID=256 RepID=UPI0039AEA8D9
MKNIKLKISLLATLALVSMGTLVTSCSSSDDNGGPDLPEKGVIDDAIGTYKGTMRVHDDIAGTDKYEFYDVVMLVTKVDNQHVKVTAKSNEVYSVVAEKVIKVEGNYNKDITSVTGDLSGFFWYHSDTKTVDIHANKQAATEIIYTFEGSKQGGK